MKNRMRIAAAGLIGMAMTATASMDLGNLWALGDSITDGAAVPSWVPGGYRHSLYTNLIARGYALQLVGTRNNNSSATLTGAGQQWHDGWSGYGIKDFSYTNPSTGTWNYNGLYDQVGGWYDSLANKPDITLLMIGINDLNQKYDEAGAPGRLDDLITLLYSKNPAMHVVVSTLPDADSNNAYRHNPPNNDLSASILDYNASMATIVSNRQALGDHITLVDMHAGLTLSDLSDGLHPNAGGYEKMGNIWADAVVAIPEPSTVGLFAVFGVGQLLVRSGSRKKAMEREALSERRREPPSF